MSAKIEITDVHDFLMENMEGIVPIDAWGETSYFYNPGKVLARGTYFLTIKEKNGDNDKASSLDRDGVWRLNFGVERKTFACIFGPPPTRPGKGCAIEGPWDFTDLDVLTPHPIYGWMSWMAVNNPSVATWEECKPLIVNAYEKAKKGFEKRVKLR